MRARFHVHGARAGFYREGTHQLCDAAATRQVRQETVAAAERLAASLDREAPGETVSLTITENLAGDERGAHFERAPRARIRDQALQRAAADAQRLVIRLPEQGAGEPQATGTAGVA